MRLTVPEIDCSEGFTRENDIFKREKFSEKLERLIAKSDDESLVIAINEKWGNGKSTFLKMWESKIKKEEKFKVVYFDAFKNDFQADPFIAISAYIYSIIEDGELKKTYLDATKRVASVLLKASLKAGISALTLGALKGTDLEEIGDDIKEGINDPLQAYIESKITQLEKEKETLENFKKIISEIAGEKKLIFIIDELDRARPDYSLELLERIKHVFNTQNIYFVLSVDKEQFKCIIKKTYGEIDATTYINKFVHLWFSLPKIDNPEINIYTLNNYINYINNKLQDGNIHLKHSLDNLSYLLRINNLTLREAERCYSLLLIMNANIESGFRLEYQIGAAIVAFLKIKDEAILHEIMQAKISKINMLEALGLTNDITDLNLHLHCAINTETMTSEEYRQAVINRDPFIFNEVGQLKTISYCAKMIVEFDF